MAIAVSLLTSEFVYAGGQTRETASFTLGANELGLAFVVNKQDGGTPPPGTVTITQTGVTWVEVTNVLYHTIASPVLRITLLRAMESSSHTSTATINVSGSSQAIYDYSIIKCTGTDTSGTSGSGAIVQSATNRADSPQSGLTVTLSALADATNNAVVVGFGGSNDHNGAVTSYTELADGTANNGDSHLSAYALPGTTTPTLTGYNSDAIAGIAVEIAVAGAAADPEGSLIGGKLIRGGLLMHGVLGR